MQWLIEQLSNVLPSFGLSYEIIDKIDVSFAFIIKMIQHVAWFVPLEVFALCFATMLLVDNFYLITKAVKWVIQILPFT